MVREERSFWVWLRRIPVFFAIILVYVTFNPWGLSYYHWAVTTWLDRVLNRPAPYTSTPDSLKAFVGVLLAIAWYVYLRRAVRTLGWIGMILAVAFFITLGYMLRDLGVISTLGNIAMQHVVLCVLGVILMLGVLLPDPSRPKFEKPKKKEKSRGLLPILANKEPSETTTTTKTAEKPTEQPPAS
ncbi:MAG: DUF6524 family protein [Myxococcota bacterium]